MGPWRDRIPINVNKSQKEIIELHDKLEKRDQTTIDIQDSNIHIGFDNRNNDLSSFILGGQLLGISVAFYYLSGGFSLLMPYWL
jgi:hypothetical protein